MPNGQNPPCICKYVCVYMYMCVCVYMFVYMCIYLYVSMGMVGQVCAYRSEEGIIGFLVAGVIDVCKPLSVGAGNGAWGLSKSSMHS